MLHVQSGACEVRIIDMRKTRILVSADGDEFKLDVYELESFIRRMNDCYLDRGHYFVLTIADSAETAGAVAPWLEELDLAFFLTEADGDARPENQRFHELLQAAQASYNKSGKPKVFVYTRIQELGNRGQGSGNREQGSVNGSQGSVDSDSAPFAEGKGLPLSINTTLFSARPYMHIDTLKFGILMQIKQLDLDGVDIRLADGKAWQGGDALLALGSVETVSGYENLQNLKQNRARLENYYIEAKARYLENPNDSAAYEAYTEAVRQRGGAIAEVKNVELQLYHMIEGMYEQTSGGKLTKRQAEAYRLAERGLIAEARDVLDFYSIVEESRHREEVAERYTKEAQINVNELLQLKDMNAALLDNEGVEACYKEAVRLEEKHDLPRKALEEYTRYLVNVFRYDDAVEHGARLTRYYEGKGAGTPDMDKVRAYTLLGRVYAHLAQAPEAEANLKLSLKLLNKMYEDDRYDGDREDLDRSIGVTYHNLGLLYDSCMRYDEACESNELSLGKRVILASRNGGVDEEYLASTYLNMGSLYKKMYRYEESMEYSLRALEIFKKLSVNDPESNEWYIPVCISSLCDVYMELERYEEAEAQAAAALEINKRLAEENPEKHDFNLANTYHDFGNLFFRTKRYPQAEEMFRSALGIVKKLAAGSPDFFEPIIAWCYRNIGEVYMETRRFGEAEEAFRESFSLYDKYAQSKPECADGAAKVRSLQGSMKVKQLRRSGADPELTAQEQEVALLLTEGITKGDIARKLHMSAEEVGLSIKVIREKVVGMADPDPTIAAVLHEYKLTSREADMLRCIRADMGIDAIADELFLSEETVRKHIRSLMKKLPVEKRQDVAAWLGALTAGNSSLRNI